MILSSQKIKIDRENEKIMENCLDLSWLTDGHYMWHDNKSLIIQKVSHYIHVLQSNKAVFLYDAECVPWADMIGEYAMSATLDKIDDITYFTYSCKWRNDPKGTGVLKKII